MIKNTHIDFDIVNTYNCKTLGLIDTSYYNPEMTISGMTLQVLVPGFESAVELNYNKSGVTILNSNTLNITKVWDLDDLVELPDGAYIIKMSICPYDQFWAEKTFYRTCKLQCLFDKALLELDLAACTNCFSEQKMQNLKLAEVYMAGIQANMSCGNVKLATSLYEKASKLLKAIIDCDCK